LRCSLHATRKRFDSISYGSGINANTIYAVNAPVWPVGAAYSAAAAVPATTVTPAFLAYG
jgi:hypothetical protein